MTEGEEALVKLLLEFRNDIMKKLDTLHDWLLDISTGIDEIEKVVCKDIIKVEGNDETDVEETS